MAEGQSNSGIVAALKVSPSAAVRVKSTETQGSVVS
jgi:hypothetical protein